TTAIVVNIPGEASSVPTAIEGYELAKQGKAGPALAIAAIASFVAGTLSVIALTFFAPTLAQFAVLFGPSEYFALMFMGLSLVISLSGRALLKGIISMALGLTAGLIGQDPLTGAERLTFGSVTLTVGVDFIAIIVGLFAISEVMINVEQRLTTISKMEVKSWMPTWIDIKNCTGAMLRSSTVGFLLGLLPGCAPSVTSFVAYDLEKRVSKHPERFGHGAMDGLAATEGSNNATSTAGFVPLFSFGLPTAPSMAVLLGGLMMYGLQPGPMLFVQSPDFVWAVIASMYIGNVMLLVLNLPMIGVWVRIVRIPFYILGPLIVFCALVGTYSVRFQTFPHPVLHPGAADCLLCPRRNLQRPVSDLRHLDHAHFRGDRVLHAEAWLPHRPDGPGERPGADAGNIPRAVAAHFAGVSPDLLRPPHLCDLHGAGLPVHWKGGVGSGQGQGARGGYGRRGILIRIGTESFPRTGEVFLRVSRPAIKKSHPFHRAGGLPGGYAQVAGCLECQGSQPS
ncbi:MAG: tripartite tricarboxylate transporter permease, partial [Desulfobacterales bacterium]|nr:tripartite tricarboxylate transporter permease [Desulfobacterales bacterium]